MCKSGPGMSPDYSYRDQKCDSFAKKHDSFSKGARYGPGFTVVIRGT